MIIGHTLRRDVGDKVLIESLTERDSKDTAGIQLADLLLGASLCPWQGDVTAEPKKRISRLVAMHLGWADTHADTYVHESKFNLWYFYDPTAGEPREVQARKVNLLYPVVPFRKGGQLMSRHARRTHVLRLLIRATFPESRPQTRRPPLFSSPALEAPAP